MGTRYESMRVELEADIVAIDEALGKAATDGRRRRALVARRRRLAYQLAVVAALLTPRDR